MSVPSPKHIYIIHARTDAEQVQRLITDLRHQDIQIWVDDSGLKAGTHDWEQTLRDVIHNAYAVLFVASPHVRRFPHLRDELALATMENIPVYPIWLAGNVWRECVPTGYDYSRFIDIRDAMYDVGIEQIRLALQGNPIQLQTQEFAAISEEDKLDEDTSPPLEPDALRRNPYSGLHAFTAANSRDFFGRGSILQELIEDVRDGIATLPFLCLLGGSGSGKSSLIQAGLLPILRDGEVSGSADWHYADSFSPTAQPMTQLARVLQPFLPEIPLNNILDTLNHPSTSGLHRLAEQIVNQPHQRLVLVIDDLEDLFTLTQSNDERQQFMDILTTAIEIPDSRVLTLAALGADYYDKPLQYGHFGRLLEERHRAILPFSLTELYHAIHQPAQLPDVQVRFETGLVAELAFALRSNRDALPLMQMTLTQLFYRRHGDKLTWAAYEVIGGIYGVIDVLAERTMSQLPTDSHRNAARTLFLGLIHLAVSDTDTVLQAAKRSELTSPTGVLEEIADAFLNTGLLVSEIQAEDTLIRISHPIVLRRWERLQHWISEAREDQHFAPIFADNVSLWIQAAQAPQRLYKSVKLAQAIAWADRNPVTENEQAFLQAAIQLRHSQEMVNKEVLQAAQISNERMVKRASALRSMSVFVLIAAIAAFIFAGFVFLLAQNQRQTAAELAGREPTFEMMQIAADAQSTAAAEAQLEVIEAQAEVTIAHQQLQAEATLAHQQIEVQMTQLADEQAYDALVQQRVATLAAGAVIMPLVELTIEPPSFIATQTQIATLNNWQAVEMVDDFGIPMVQVPAGCFYMGSLAQVDEQPPHLQCFDAPFWIDKFEMTNDFYIQVTNEGSGSQFPNGSNPVDSISWFEARDVCLLREAHLPTEAEWEYAARGVDSLLFPWGNVFVEENVVYQRLVQEGALAVISVTRSPLRPESASWVGAVDMLGNIEEWTNTIFDELDFSQQIFDFQNLFAYPYRADDGREADETREQFQERVNTSSIFTLRVLRGGSYTNSDGLRAANRSWDDADDEDVTSGFRCVRS